MSKSFKRRKTESFKRKRLSMCLHSRGSQGIIWVCTNRCWSQKMLSPYNDDELTYLHTFFFFFFNFGVKKVYKKAKWEPVMSDHSIPPSGSPDDLLGPVCCDPVACGPMILCLRTCCSPKERSNSTRRQIRRGRCWDRRLATPYFLGLIFKPIDTGEACFRSHILAHP